MTVEYWQGGKTITEYDEEGVVRRQGIETPGEITSLTNLPDGDTRVFVLNTETGEVVRDEIVPAG